MASHPKNDKTVKRGASAGPQVRATKVGHYAGLLRQPGEVFTLDSEKHFSKRWMEEIGAKEAKAVQAADDVLESAALSGASVSPRLKSAAEVELDKREANLLSASGVDVNPPDPRASVEAQAAENDAKKGSKNRSI